MKRHDNQKAGALASPGIVERIGKIINDTGLSIESRMDAVLELRHGGEADEENDPAPADDIAVYSSLVAMLKKEDGGRVRELMQLYTLLAETYADMDDCRPLDGVAAEVLELMREKKLSAEICRETVPRLADAIGNSVYNHALYEILLRHAVCVLGDNPDDASLKPQAGLLLKLHALLDDTGWLRRLWDKNLRSSIARMFAPEELLGILVDPKIGCLRRDPVEYTLQWEHIYYDVEEEVGRIIGDEGPYMGQCFHIWSEKRELLKKKYGIDWRSPSQMNPGVMFD